ncbi:MAG: hypothetical protein K2X41_01560 [Hyphomicrobium sp.]|nr:hypothetical protein [Hyphomicrobium sp.]
MKTPNLRLHNQGVQAALDALDNLRGQALADADYNKKLDALRWMVQREILASYGQAMTAYAGQWEALDRRHRAQKEAFDGREGGVTGRIVNLASTIPTESFAAAMRHVREGLLSSEIRQNALALNQKQERDELASRQRRYREWLCEPHQDVLEFLSRPPWQETDKAELSNDTTNFESALLRSARQRIAAEMARSLNHEPRMAERPVTHYAKARSMERKNEQDID